MDTLRGNFADGAGFGESYYGGDAGDDLCGPEAPPSPVGQDERRMQVRAYNFWTSLLKDRHFPSIEDIDPHALPDFGPYSVLLDFTAGLENPGISYLGQKLAGECGTDIEITQLSDIPSRSLLSRITDHYMQILANQAPIGFEAEFLNLKGLTVLYRGILLPFSSDDDTIDFIYGVINWKELADQQTTEQLLQEFDQALKEQGHRLAIATDAPPRLDWPADRLSHAVAADDDYDEEDDEVLDLGAFIRSGLAREEGHIPQAGFNILDEDPLADGIDDGPAPMSLSEPDADAELADWLACARELAQLASAGEDRTRRTLYDAIGRAYDFSLAAAQAPEDFTELLADAGLARQDRAPMTPVVKLVFGADYDKTRITEYATILAHAHRLGLAVGDVAPFLAQTPGGLKAVVAEERRLRREESGKPSKPDARTARVQARLRGLEPLPLENIARDGAEFALVLIRRLDDGSVSMLGELQQDDSLIEKAARQLIS